MLKRNEAANGVGVEDVIEKHSRAGKVSQQAVQHHFLRSSGGLLAVIGESLETSQENPKMEKGEKSWESNMQHFLESNEDTF